MTTAGNKGNKVNDIFMFARYIKEDFDSDNYERKRKIIKRSSANLKFSV